MAGITITLANGQEVGKTLEEITKQVNRAATELKKAEIGSEEFVKAQQKFQQLKGVQEDLNKQIKGTTVASNEWKKSLGDILNQIPGFGAMSGALVKMRAGVGGLTSGFGLLRAAIISTGIGALVVLLGSLISYLTTTQSGMDKLTAVTRPLQAIFQRLIGVLQILGEQVFNRLAEAINNPRQAFIDLGNAIQENIINRFEALALFGPAIAKILRGEFADGFKDLGNAVLQLGTGVEDVIGKIENAAVSLASFVDEAVKQGQRLDQLQKQIERAEINQITRSKQLDLIIKQQKAIVEDTTKSWDDRRKAAEAALAAQQQLLRSELSVIDMKIEKMQLEQSLNDTSREQEKELAELKAKRFEIEAQITEQSIEFSKKVTEINVAQAQEELAIRQNTEDLKLAVRTEGMDKEIAAVELETQRKIEALKGSEAQIAEQRALLLQQQEQQIQAIRDDYARQAAEKKLEDNELQLAIDQNLLNEQLLNEELTREAYLQRTAQRLLEFQQQKLDIIREAHGIESAEYQKAYAEYLALQQAQADQAVAIKQKEMQDQLAAIQGALGTFGNFFGTLASFQKQGTQQWKAFATASAIMSTIQGSINAYTSTAAIPIVGPALAPIAAGLAFAAGMANVRRIQNTKVEPPTAAPKAERGGPTNRFRGLLRGLRHSQGGIPIEAEDGEFIFSRKAVQAIGVGTLTRINDRYTRSMETGGPVNPFPDRGPVSSGNGDMANLERLLMANFDAVNRRIDRIKVENVVTETRDKINAVNSIQEEADV